MANLRSYDWLSNSPESSSDNYVNMARRIHRMQGNDYDSNAPAEEAEALILECMSGVFRILQEPVRLGLGALCRLTWGGDALLRGVAVQPLPDVRRRPGHLQTQALGGWLQPIAHRQVPAGHEVHVDAGGRVPRESHPRGPGRGHHP